MKNVIPGTFYNLENEATPETILISFFDSTLRIRLELGERTMFTLPFSPVAALIKACRADRKSASIERKITIRGHFANLQNNIAMTCGDISATYVYHTDVHAELLGFSAPDCGKIQVRLDRLIPYMDRKLKKAIGDETEI